MVTFYQGLITTIHSQHLFIDHFAKRENFDSHKKALQKDAYRSLANRTCFGGLWDITPPRKITSLTPLGIPTTPLNIPIPPFPGGQNDRHLWKRYLPATTVAGGKKSYTSCDQPERGLVSMPTCRAWPVDARAGRRRWFCTAWRWLGSVRAGTGPS